MPGVENCRKAFEILRPRISDLTLGSNRVGFALAVFPKSAKGGLGKRPKFQASHGTTPDFWKKSLAPYAIFIAQGSGSKGRDYGSYVIVVAGLNVQLAQLVAEEFHAALQRLEQQGGDAA